MADILECDNNSFPQRVLVLFFFFKVFLPGLMEENKGIKQTWEQEVKSGDSVIQLENDKYVTWVVDRDGSQR